MKKTEGKQERPQALKRKLMSALAMLLVSTILMTTTSYAWFVLSTAPEVTGIETQVGANGSLEIALLNTETRTDMSKIRSGMGDSLAANNMAANYAWGNLVDLGIADYGLGQILLLPSRLNTVGNQTEGYTVDPGMLAIPTYGYDGRVISLDDNTVSAIYQNNEFSFVTGVQDYGVRAIGTSDAVSAQESALANAKGNIPTYTKSARTNAQKVLENYGDAVFNIMLNHMSNADYIYGNEERDSLRNMLQDLQKSLSDIDVSLRQGLVAVAASELGDEDTFNTVKDRILDSSKTLKTILSDLSELSTIPAEISLWVNALDNMQNDLNAAMNACNLMTSGSYTWTDIRAVMNYVMNVDYVYIEDSLFANVDQAVIMDKALAGEEITMTLAPGSGIYAGIADFAGNYSMGMKVSIANILITTASAEKPAYLQALANAVNELEAASGGSADLVFPLSTTYGYALDLAFRCNAPAPDLVLQTKGIQRVYEESDSASTQGGGSYMAFTSSDESLTQEQRLLLMDAIRVGFVDDQGKLLAVAKLNVSNYAVEDGMLNAPLYLYEYSFSEEDGAMIIGERKLTDNVITTEMQQNVAKAVTVVVWLDGDLVDNSMVSATEAASLSGVMNLQFATSAELIPATDGTLLNYTADLTGLLSAVEAYRATFNAGQSATENGQVTYTNVSWNAFAAAFNRAVTVSENANAGAVEVANALRKLVAAGTGLEVVSKDAVNEKIEQLRAEMGEVSDDISRYVIKNADGTYSVVGDVEHTQEEHDSWEIVGQINRVDYNKNLNDEGNEIFTPNYSDATWNALAAALYEAEAVTMNPDATDDQINAVLTALENAEKALSRQVFFTPYEYRGSIYYAAVCEAENADTYGKWYDSNFQRILSEVTILNLDAYAEPATIIAMGQNLYVARDTDYITPDVTFLEEVFPELRGVEVKGVHWNEIDSDLFIEMMNQLHYNTLADLVYMVDYDAVLQYEPTDECVASRDAADELITKWINNEEVTAAEAETAISNLNDQIIDLYDQNLDKMEEASAAMMENQRILLTAAVNAAKAVDGFDDPASVEDAEEKAKLETLVANTTAAEALLQNSGTKDEASTALTELNTALKAVGGKEVTEYNTLTHKLPDGIGEDDIVYSVDYPGINLKLTGKSGTTTLGAQVLTKDGVVISVEKDITVYDMADGIRIMQNDSNIGSLYLSASETADITAQLYWEAGGINTGDKSLDEIVQEDVKRYIWASTDTNVATVVPMEEGICTVTALSAGNAQITLSIETQAGNYYSIEIPIIVS